MAEAMAPSRHRRDAANNVRRRLRREADHAVRDAERAVETAAIIQAAARQREIRVVNIGRRRVALGAFAGTDIRHPFVPDGHTGTSCMACFGWSNDVRHWPGGEGGNRG